MRKRKDFERPEGIKSARLVVIAAEGRNSENIYFEAMKTERCASDVHVEILHRDSNDSSPESVYKQIRGFIAEYNIEDDDQLWVVVDRDKWKNKMLSSVAQHCAQNGNLHFCVSNPCFELWLLLHVEDIASYDKEQMEALSLNRKVNCQDTWLKKRMKDLTGHYHESDYDAAALLQHIVTAMERAEKLDVSPKDRWPQSVGTRVYLLAKSIMNL
ncbi:RloB-like protein [Bacteroides heparinolyticus]|uniref:RloB-like protein n=1 Tax=Prevotella heparinolytica TaxID=28113 RepID=A0A4R2LN53_9BACE|nr:RloB family protein [Bacteroides heparinolyticus]TCO90002.1 RloB-like protein [Bacteroides heparinolyticus]